MNMDLALAKKMKKGWGQRVVIWLGYNNSLAQTSGNIAAGPSFMCL